VLISIVVMGAIFEGSPIALILSVPLFAVMVELGKMFIEARLVKKGFPTDTAEYFRGATTEDEIDLAIHYQNRKLAYYFERSKIKKWLDRRREQKAQKKLQQQAAKQAAAQDQTELEQTEPIEQVEQVNTTEAVGAPNAQNADDTAQNQE
jgi:hypothetical protein